MVLEFEVNEYLTLKLEEDKTVIFVNGERFQQCKILILDIPIEEITSFKRISSIDEAVERINRSLEYKKINRKDIPPEIVFWGHCSNLQVWAEHRYDTRLIPSSLAFPLLKKLTDFGDPIATRVFKKEIKKRLESGFPNVVNYLIKEKYVDYLDREEILNVESLKKVNITLILIFINIFIYIFLNLSLPKDYIYFFLINQNIIDKLEIWRVFTSMFIHANLMHLFINMISLILFGAIIETKKKISKYKYLFIYFLSGLIGNLSFLTLLPANVFGTGSSGSIFGLFGASIIIVISKKRYSSLFLLSLLLFTSLYLSLAPTIVFLPHLFGLFGGFLCGYLFFIYKNNNLLYLSG